MDPGASNDGGMASRGSNASNNDMIPSASFDDDSGVVRFDESSNKGPSTRSKRRSMRIPRLMSQVYLPRLIPRDYPYDQSSNQVRIYNINGGKSLWHLMSKDWFHVLLRVDARISFPTMLLIWYLMLWVFAVIYHEIDRAPWNKEKDCGLAKKGEPIELMAAFAFSLETCTTVGYGLPGDANGFFGANCFGLQNAILAQMVWSMLSNAFLVSFFFAQMSKSETRSVQILFSKKLCINVVDGKICVNVRCFDLDSSHPLVECHARMYLLDHKMKFHPLRLLEPNDDLGGVLYPSAPTTIIHHIDHHSPLSPGSMPLVEGDHGLALRSVDSATANREEVLCPVCGEAYGTYDRLVKHIEYARIVEKQDGYPVEGTHLGFKMPEISPITLSEVQRLIETRLSEIVVVVEAIDPQLSGTFQGVQSYKYEDIEFGADFERCMFTRDNKFVVDLKKFHGIIYDDDMYSSNEFPSIRKHLSENCTICPGQSVSEESNLVEEES